MTGFTNSQQIVLAAQSLLFGVGIGIVYDILRAVRRFSRCGRRGTALCDALFWLIVLGALFAFGLIPAAGQPRGFVLLSAGGGAGLYFAVLSGEVLRALVWLLRTAAGLYRRLCGLWAACRETGKRLCASEKNRELSKKFEKSSFLFRGKGIK